MTITGLYIDDDPEQRDLYKDLLSAGDFDFSTDILPSGMTHLINTILDTAPDIVVMDYRLDGTKRDDWDNNFKAGGVAQVLRDRFVDAPEKDVPLVLLSTETNIRTLFAPDKTSHDLFDTWFLKDELHSGKGSRRDEILQQLRSLVSSYRRIKELREIKVPQELARNLLNIEQDEYDEVQPEGLKLTLLNSDGEAERPHVISRQILHNVIKQPGILVGRDGLRARFGITEDSFDTLVKHVDLSAFLYDGIFSSGWKRYWKHRFEKWEVENFDTLLGSMTGEERAAALSEKFGFEANPAVSRWTGQSSEYFSVACSVCSQPTELKHSVAVFAPKLLSFMQRNRVCYDCIEREEGMRKLRVSIAEADELTVADIREERIVRPKSDTQ